jgi:hypothetical protein
LGGKRKRRETEVKGGIVIGEERIDGIHMGSKEGIWRVMEGYGNCKWKGKGLGRDQRGTEELECC